MDNTTQICPICDRPLGLRREAHHVVPKSKGGRETVAVHPICHRTVHKTFSNQELARLQGDIVLLRAHPAMTKFIQWVARKPNDFYARTR